MNRRKWAKIICFVALEFGCRSFFFSFSWDHYRLYDYEPRLQWNSGSSDYECLCVCVLYMCVFCWIFYSVSSGLFLWHVIYFVSGDCVFLLLLFLVFCHQWFKLNNFRGDRKVRIWYIGPRLRHAFMRLFFFCFNKFIALGSERSAHA